MKNNEGLCRAHTNIALIKYWGKRNEELFLPMNSSLSLTLDAFYTDTKVSLDETLEEDLFFLDGELQPEKERQKITHFLDLFRQAANQTIKVRVESYNHVPTAAGLASSASAFAALAGAANQAFNLGLSLPTLSTFARRGSGSSTRSLFGGFVEWKMGIDDDSTSSYAIPIDNADWDIAMLVIAVNKSKKKLSSRVGMKQTVATSPFYPAWVESAATDLIEVKKAIAARNFIRLGEITEANGMKMHGTMLGATPPISYWEPDSIKAIKKVQEIREQGLPCYVTMDAGPNVKVLCRQSDIEQIKQYLLNYFKSEQLISSKVGAGIQLLKHSDWMY
ncbi:diphosphomevalonate decarboxylase [Vagococcus sp.]|uniref:diphosphomevalonate decarboxylase n=1 Tax=Vagococcus sp. TaxID=1933889 RepID=UPI003F951076